MRAVNFFLANHWPGRRQQYRQYIRRAAALGSMSGGGLHDSEVAHSHATTSARAQVSVQTACGHVTMRQHYIHVNITRWWCGGSVSADRSATPWRSTRRHSSAKAKAGLTERLLSFTPGARRRVVSQDTPCCWMLARQAERGFFVCYARALQSQACLARQAASDGACETRWAKNSIQ